MRPLPRRPVLGPDEVRALLPQVPPFLFVDRVVGFRGDPEPALAAELDLPAEHPIFAAHFPGRPLWPGALVVEGLAQCAQLLLMLRGLPGPAGTGVLSEVAVRLLRPIPPGGPLVYRVDLIGSYGLGFRVAAEARLGRTPVAEGTLAVALIPQEAPVEPS